MATFKELREKSEKLINKKTVLNYVVGNIEDTFRGSGSNDKNVLLRPDQVRVPVYAFDDAVAEMLSEIDKIDKELEEIFATPLPTTKN